MIIGVGRGGPGLRNFSKKRLFLVSSGKKTNFTTFASPYKNFGKLPVLYLKNPSDDRVDDTCASY